MLPKEIKETTFEFVDTDNVAYFYSAIRKWVNKAKRLAEMYPDEVRVVAENKDGSICITCPKNWFKISPPKKKRALSEEERDVLRERLQRARVDGNQKDADTCVLDGDNGDSAE